MTVLKFRKLESAELQLREAIMMHFRKRDPVSIHTLACASHEVLRSLLQASGATDASIMKDNPAIREDKKKEWGRLINGPSNFFKHADRDHSEILEFDPEFTHVILLDAVFMLDKLTGTLFREAEIFQFWFAAKHPQLMKEGYEKSPSQRLVKAAKADGVDFTDIDMCAKLLPT